MFKKVAWFVMTLLAVSVSSYALVIVANDSMRPQFIARIIESRPMWAYMHLVCGSIALAVGAFQFNTYLRQRFVKLHRVLGGTYVVNVTLAGFAGFILAIQSHTTFMGKLGFALSGVIWIVTTLIALQFILTKNIQAHRKWMIRSYAVSLSAVTLRVYLPIVLVSGMSFSYYYPIIAWVSWLPNILLVELYFLWKARVNDSNLSAEILSAK